MVGRTRSGGRVGVMFAALMSTVLVAVGVAPVPGRSAATAVRAQRNAPFGIVARDGQFELLGWDGAVGASAPVTVANTGVEYDLWLENEGSRPYGAQLLQLREGVTAAALVAAAQADVRSAWRLATPVGGIAPLPPGALEHTLFIFTEPGNYVVASLPDLAEGMAAPFRVEGEPARVDPVRQWAVSPEETVRLEEFSFVLPAERPAAVRNAGEQPHELRVARLADGVTVANVRASAGDAEADGLLTWSGGVAAIAPGMVALVHLPRAPGRYVLLCTVPDPATGQSHAALGMVAEYDVP